MIELNPSMNSHSISDRPRAQKRSVAQRWGCVQIKRLCNSRPRIYIS